MKITALVENVSNCELKATHGLSLYIETEKHKLLFDLGPDDTLFDNARSKGIDLTSVDTVIISHGHDDHGGALERFLAVNSAAKVYVQSKAFAPHYSNSRGQKASIGLNRALERHAQVVLLDGDSAIDDELRVFTVSRTDKCHSGANDSLYAETGRDDFQHEQNLMIQGNPAVLIIGCGHTGIVNIMEKAALDQPQVCVGGFHLFSPSTKKTVPESLLQEIVQELQKFNHMRFYTCHCTGREVYGFLAKQMPNMHYLSCGETITV